MTDKGRRRWDPSLVTKLVIMLEERRGQANDGAKKSQWLAHQDIERGNAVRVYSGEKFVLKE